MSKPDEIFPILDLPRELFLIIIHPRILDVASARNFILSCKRVYECIPKHIRLRFLRIGKYVQRSESLWSWFSSHIHFRTPPPPSPSGKGTCSKCGIFLRRKYFRHVKRCKGYRECYMCMNKFYRSHELKHLALSNKSKKYIGPYHDHYRYNLLDSHTQNKWEDIWKIHIPGSSVELSYEEFMKICRQVNIQRWEKLENNIS